MNCFFNNITMLTQIMKHSNNSLQLERNKFRRNLHLNSKEKDIYYIYGEDITKEHARRIITERLEDPMSELGDGHQTPMSGHPVFRAMHATATCCRDCLFKCYGIPKYRHLEMHEVDFVVNLIMDWIRAKA